MEILVVKFINSYLKKELDIVKVNDEKMHNLKVGTKIVVEKSNNFRLAEVYNLNKITDVNDTPNDVYNFIRIATKRDLSNQTKNEEDSKEVFDYVKKVSDELHLDMHFVDSYYTFDRKKMFISYVADNRIDFRELTKILAQKYKTRIELRQIGVRDKAQKIGGIGPCGLFLCCNSFLTDFSSLSINMAKNQFLALNPAKINGVCGRLLCCLKYEDDVYTELRKDFPEVGEVIKINNIEGKVIEVNLLLRTYTIETKSKEIIEIKND